MVSKTTWNAIVDELRTIGNVTVRKTISAHDWYVMRFDYDPKRVWIGRLYSDKYVGDNLMDKTRIVCTGGMSDTLVKQAFAKHNVTYTIEHDSKNRYRVYRIS